MAREGYLWHQGEETIHSEKLARPPKTGKEKRQNFWYYHKWHVLIAAVVILAAIFLVRDFLTRDNPDYKIGLVTSRSISEEGVEAMEAQLELYGEDLNGDGVVEVAVDNYSLDATNSDAVMANITRLIGDFQAGETMLYFCYETGYNYIDEQEGWDAEHKQMEVPDAFQGDLELTADMRFMTDETWQDEDDAARWNAAYTLYENLAAGNAVTPEEETAHGAEALAQASEGA